MAAKVRAAVATGPLEQAMTHYAAGDDAALGAVYDLASPAIFSFLMRLCRGNRELAEDLTHETFLRVHRSRGLYRPDAAVLPWTYTIARHLFLDHLRAHRREVPYEGASRDDEPNEIVLVAGDPGADEMVAAHDLAHAIEEALGNLPENQATAFRLLKQEGMSLGDAAAVLGTTTTAIKLRAHRAYEALRVKLSSRWDLPAKDER